MQQRYTPAGKLTLDTLEQEKMILQVEEYFSMVLRRLCCASLDSLSTSLSSRIL